MRGKLSPPEWPKILDVAFQRQIVRGCGVGMDGNFHIGRDTLPSMRTPSGELFPGWYNTVTPLPSGWGFGMPDLP